MIKIDDSQTTKKYEYILRWPDLLEKYVRYNKKKDEYEEVIVMEAQIFKTIKEVETFISAMTNEGYEKPEIVKMICKAIA